MNSKVKAFFEKDHAPFVVLTAAMLVLHFMVPGLIKDDRYYWNVLNERDTMTYLRDNWNNWTSRIFIEGVAIWVEHLPMVVWKLLDTGIYTAAGWQYPHSFSGRIKGV